MAILLYFLYYSRIVSSYFYASSSFYRVLFILFSLLRALWSRSFAAKDGYEIFYGSDPPIRTRFRTFLSGYG
jgi:hypothetical protein